MVETFACHRSTRTSGLALDVWQKVRGTPEGALLLLAMLTPVCAVKLGACRSEMLCERPSPRIIRRWRFHCVIEMERKDKDRRSGYLSRQPRPPREILKAGRTLERCDCQNAGHQCKRCEAIGTRGVEDCQRHRS